jgi:hypothetical protein
MQTPLLLDIRTVSSPAVTILVCSRFHIDFEDSVKELFYLPSVIGLKQFRKIVVFFGCFNLLNLG